MRAAELNAVPTASLHGGVGGESGQFAERMWSPSLRRLVLIITVFSNTIARIGTRSAKTCGREL